MYDIFWTYVKGQMLKDCRKLDDRWDDETGVQVEASWGTYLCVYWLEWCVSNVNAWLLHGYCMIILWLIPPGGLTYCIHTSSDISLFSTMHDNTKFSHSSYEGVFEPSRWNIPSFATCVWISGCGRCTMALKRWNEIRKMQLAFSTRTQQKNIIEFVLV